MNKSVSIYNWILLVLFLLNLTTLLQSCYILNPILENVLIGSLVSFIFYFIVVFIPAYLRKENLKRVFLHFYDDFKEDVLREVLHLMEFDGDEYEKIKELKNTDLFIEFAQDASQTEGQTNWHVLMNNIDEEDCKHSLKAIVVKLSELQREADFLIRTAGVEDGELLKKFRHLDRVLQDGRYKDELDWNWGEDKRFTDSLYELLSGWSIVNGKNGDFIQQWVKKL